MQLAKKTVLTNNAMTKLGTSKRLLEDAIIDLHKNDNDNWAVGDIKTTSRTITDSNWHKCDGNYALGNLSNNIRDNLLMHNQIKMQKIAMLDTSATDRWHYYCDDNYVIICAAYQASGGSGWTKLFVYTRDANGNVVANSQKTLRTVSYSRYDTYAGPIVKCGSYYYCLYYYAINDGDGSNDNSYWYLAYTTNPTGTWSQRTLYAGQYRSGIRYLLGMYTNGSQVRVDLSANSSGRSSNPPEVTVYTFSGDGSNATTSTYSWSNTNTTATTNLDPSYNIYPVGDGKFVQLRSLPAYKSSFTANWSTLTTPSWASSWRALYYINGKYWGIFVRSSSSSDYGFYVAYASTLSALTSTALANLPHWEIDTGRYLYSTYEFYGRTNSALWMIVPESITVDSTTISKTYLYSFTENGLKKILLSDDYWGSYVTGAANGAYAAVAHSDDSSYKNNFYFIGAAYPDMTNEPYDAYMKIATN